MDVPCHKSLTNFSKVLVQYEKTKKKGTFSTWYDNRTMLSENIPVTTYFLRQDKYSFTYCILFSCLQFEEKSIKYVSGTVRCKWNYVIGSKYSRYKCELRIFGWNAYFLTEGQLFPSDEFHWSGILHFFILYTYTYYC